METELWLGSLALYQAYTERTETAKTAMLSGQYEGSQDSNPPENFTLFDNVAVIDVTGALTNEDGFWTWLNGDTSYNQIRRGLIEAATHQDVKAILYNIDSGGGTPNGLDDVAKMNRQISSMGIPVYAYSGGMMASAAYWLGASTDQVFCGETALLGSIGVISIHRDVTGLLKQQGITATVFRAGDEKALSNPYEKLSDKAREQIQERLNSLYDVFINNIADYRGLSSQYVREHMAGGKEFTGQQAVDARLADRMMSLDALIADIQSKCKPNSKEGSMPRKTTVMTQQMQDALLEGIAPEVVMSNDPEPVEEAPADPAPAPTPEPVAAEVTEATQLAASQVAMESELVSVLRAELSAVRNELVQMAASNKAMETKVTAMEATHEPMKKLVAASISRMQVALGSPAMDLSDLPAELVLAQHSKVMETFCKKFPVGGVASIGSEQAEEATPYNLTAISQARLRQNKF